jgi:DNA-binding NtrC family response regulator
MLLSTIHSLVSRRAMPEDVAPSTLLLMDARRLPAEVQPELARLLSGAPKNVRVIATALESLDAPVAAGQFRADLASLLSTLVIELPPLASRRSDIPLVAQLLVEDWNSQSDKQLRGFTTEAMDCLCQHDWPGQIDELAGVVREACQQAESFEVSAVDLPKRMRLAADAARFASQPPQPIDLEKFLAQVETELIERAMRLAKGNKSRAAALLRLNRPRLYRRMVQLGLEPDSADPTDNE